MLIRSQYYHKNVKTQRIFYFSLTNNFKSKIWKKHTVSCLNDHLTFLKYITVDYVAPHPKGA